MHWSIALATGSRRHTVAADHAGCSVGSYVHGFTTREQAAQAEDTAMLVSAGWVSREALAALPTLPAGTGRLDYVPLAELEVDPDLMLLSLSPEQLMAVQSAIPELKLTGKPQCSLAAAGVPCARRGHCFDPGGRIVIVEGYLPDDLRGRVLGAVVRAASAATVLGEIDRRPWDDLAEFTDEVVTERRLFGMYVIMSARKPA